MVIQSRVMTSSYKLRGLTPATFVLDIFVSVLATIRGPVLAISRCFYLYCRQVHPDDSLRDKKSSWGRICNDQNTCLTFRSSIRTHRDLNSVSFLPTCFDWHHHFGPQFLQQSNGGTWTCYGYVCASASKSAPSNPTVIHCQSRPFATIFSKASATVRNLRIAVAGQETPS